MVQVKGLGVANLPINASRLNPRQPTWMNNGRDEDASARAFTFVSSDELNGLLLSITNVTRKILLRRRILD